MQNNVTVEKILVSYDPEVQNLLPVLKKISAVFGFIGSKDAEIVAEYFGLSLANRPRAGSTFKTCLTMGSEKKGKHTRNYENETHTGAVEP